MKSFCFRIRFIFFSVLELNSYTSPMMRRRESGRAAQLEDFVWALRRIHCDLGWPWPSGSYQPSEDRSTRSRQGNPSKSYAPRDFMLFLFRYFETFVFEFWGIF